MLPTTAVDLLFDVWDGGHARTRVFRCLFAASTVRCAPVASPPSSSLWPPPQPTPTPPQITVPQQEEEKTWRVRPYILLVGISAYTLIHSLIRLLYIHLLLLSIQFYIGKSHVH
ncbi:hypothetical protein EGR_10696 [Echinococcus granulosus]|uniref:Uncharacterized protein n=1 Tax=Echinococcus granulosus TaxID=6210 RepID=W6ULT4_ECHGR|nr:hypothetical protein EGR_10696 [Echinococcus granulosus]EUB54444.1 hypothetical protein EGR_10696 [Echinococcus granulosus]